MAKSMFLSRPFVSFTGSSIFPLLLVNFIGALGYSIILPFLVFLVQDFGGNAILYGFLGAVYPAFQLVGAPWLGRWSDKVGRKKVLLISQAGTLLSWLIFLLAFLLPETRIFALTTNAYGPILFTLPLLILVVARALDGLTGGNISVANAYLSDISSEKDRKVNFGKMSAAMNLGFIIGPVIAGLLAAQASGYWLIVATAALISLLCLFIIYFLLPDIKAQPEVSTCMEEKIKKVYTIEHKDCYQQPEASNTSMQALFRLKNAPLMILLYFMIFLGFNFFYAAFPVYASSTLSWSSAQLGLFFTLLSGVMILVQGPLLSRLAKRFKEEQLFMVGNLILVITFACMAVQNLALIYLAAVLFGVGNGIMWPSYLSMLSKLGTRRQQGSIQGIASSSGSLASIIGLLVGGFVFSLLSEGVFLLSALLLFIIFLISIQLLFSFQKDQKVAVEHI